MKSNHDNQLISTKEDARVSSLGDWLRNYKLDELPQLINILMGEMSFVGPRPEVPKFVSAYPKEYEKILTVRPGLTDPASIAFRNESELLEAKSAEKTYIGDILPIKIKHNLKYVSHHSFLGDCALIFRTLWAIIRKP